MAKFIEQLNGGMVPSKDPSTLQPGEMQLAAECMYYHDNEHLARVPGVSAWTTVLEGSIVNGLVACRFEDGTQKLLAQVSASGGEVAYYMGDAETNGSTFTTAVTGLTGGDTVTSVQYDNRHYIFNGVDDNQVLLKDGTFRPHGLTPVPSGGMKFKEVNNTVTSGPTVTGFYEYWYTEVVTFSDGQQLESAFNGDSVTYELTQTTSAPVFRLPSTPINDNIVNKYNATVHYNIYRSEKKLSQTDRMYPVGRKCGTVTFTTNAADPANPQIEILFTDTATKSSTADSDHLNQNSVASILCGVRSTYYYNKQGGETNNNYLTTVTGNFYNATGGPIVSTIPSVLSPTNTNYLRIEHVKGASGWADRSNGAWASSPHTDDWYMFNLKGFNFGTITGANISGVGVVINGYASQNGIADIYVMPCKYNAENGPMQLPAPGGTDLEKPSRIVYYKGGPYYFLDAMSCTTYTDGRSPIYSVYPNVDYWRIESPFTQGKPINESLEHDFGYGASNTDTAAAAFLTGKYQWQATDITNEFGVQVLVRFKNLTSAHKPHVVINSLQMYIEFNGTNSRVTKDTKFYDATTVEISGVQSGYGSNKKPPTASTGTIFSGSLVTNSKDEPNKIYYSVPGFPDYFPTDLYWFELPGVDNDRITYLGIVNDRLVVGTRGSLWRINYLPSQDDAGFARGQAVSLISDTVGIVNPNAACIFTNQQGQQELAFVDTNGVFSTDGYAIRKLSQDLLWVGPGGRAVFSPSAQTNAYTNVYALANDPRTQTLRLLTSSYAWAGSYAAIHQKPGGGLKWTRYNRYRATYDNNSDTVHSSGARTVECIRRINGTWIVVYGFGLGGNGGSIVREDSSDTTTSANNPMAYLNAAYPTILTREINPAGLTGEFSVDGIGIHGTIKTNANLITFTNIGADVSTTQRQTNAGFVTSSTTIPGGVSGSRTSYAGIDGINADSVAFSMTLHPGYYAESTYENLAGLFEIHAIILDVDNFGEVDTGA